MNSPSPRLACRAIIVQDGRLLLVNAYPDGQSDLWCAPGGGAQIGQSLPDNLVREVHEETGLEIRVGDLLGVDEFHNPDDDFHQVDLFFQAQIIGGGLTPEWQDPEGIVTERRFFSLAELAGLRFKPDFLIDLAFRQKSAARYSALERMVP